ncbi:hypothetical protein F6X37_03465 [Paraburkholderia sp. 31.1]|uniref:hypothetical protein n=1 Tax=Paraburkholderia sp. 31.1 TaxID=2615205 RepID=UPI0016567E0F|nr:hypothetical protein [Paraburkholderia sp. 31.1]MBC8720699.1 hypothetical protein [Paraburkholderia sp. 31.1]
MNHPDPIPSAYHGRTPKLTALSDAFRTHCERQIDVLRSGSAPARTGARSTTSSSAQMAGALSASVRRNHGMTIVPPALSVRSDPDGQDVVQCERLRPRRQQA